MGTRTRVWQGPPELRRALEPLEKIKPLDRNRRRGDVEAVRESLREHGQYKPIIVRRENGQVLVGNHTAQAAREEGWTHVAVLWRSEPDDQKAERLAIVDNRTSDLAEWDVLGLAEDLQRLSDAGGLAGTGFTEAQLGDTLREARALAASEAGAALASLQDPDTPAPPKKPTTRPGDVIRLGAHVLVCGDSTDTVNARVGLEAIDAKHADMLFTSPPYNVGVRYYGQQSDDRADTWETYGGFLRRVLEATIPALAAGRAVVWNIGVAPATYPAHQHLLLEDVGLTFHRQIVWDKKLPGIPKWHAVLADPRARHFPVEYQHELMLVFSHGPLERGAHLPELDPLARTSVMGVSAINARKDVPAGPHAAGSIASMTGIDRAERRANGGTPLNRAWEKAHPAVMPADIIRPFIGHLTAPGEIVLDPFGGAGTTLLVAEQRDRRAVLVEIDPGYCDVIVTRWQNLTGETATRPRRTPRKKAKA